MAHTLPLADRYRNILIALGIAFLLLLAATAPVARAEGPDEQEQRARAIARDLQCPICENNSILDSPSELAHQMVAIVKEQVAAGKSREEIVRYFVDRYGEGVLREPPKEGFTLLVWLGPVIALGIAAAVVANILSNRTRGVATTAAGRDADAAAGSDEAPFVPADTARYTALVEQEVARLEEGRR